MKVNCEIVSSSLFKKGMKIVLSIPVEEVENVQKNIHNFIMKPITVDFLVHVEKYVEQQNQISPEQRKKIYAMFKDIANYSSDSPENMKEHMKSEFLKATQYDDFSLSNCEKELASSLIGFMIVFCFENGIPMSEEPDTYLKDIESWLSICLNQEKCCVCGKEGKPRKWDGDTRISLCDIHLGHAKTVGRDEFKAKYKVWGI